MDAVQIATERPVVDEKKNGAGGSPTRTYVILEQQAFEDTGDNYFVELKRVEARNAPNALRRAFRELRGAEEGEAVWVAIPENTWQPKPVRGKRRDDITVSIGA